MGNQHDREEFRRARDDGGIQEAFVQIIPGNGQKQYNDQQWVCEPNFLGSFQQCVGVTGVSSLDYWTPEFLGKIKIIICKNIHQ